LTSVSIAFSFYLVNLQSKNETTINSKQIENISNKFDTLDQSIITLGNEIKSIDFPAFPDTVNARLTSPVEIKK